MAELLMARAVSKRFGGLVAVNSVDFSIEERAIRETMAIVTVLSVIAGRTRCHSTSASAPGLPESKLSIV